MVRLSSTGALLGALAHAREITAQAYTLHGSVLRALEAAARRGAHVVIRLDGNPYDDAGGSLLKENRRLVGVLRAAHADAALAEGLHAKTVTADGVLYLDERNWGDEDLVLRDDDPADARAIPMLKSEALELERQLLQDTQSGDAIVETESLGRHNAVYAELKRLGEQGRAPRLLVSARDLRGNAKERAALDELAAAGVRVRTCKDSEKFALAGARAWLGSANATVAFDRSNLVDWGLTTGDPAIVESVRDRIEAQWRASVPLEPAKAQTPKSA